MEKLRAYIDAHFPSHTAFAREVGVSKGFMSQILSGDKTPSLKIAVQISRSTNGEIPVEAWVENEAKKTNRSAA